jgi:hypothetical protein
VLRVGADHLGADRRSQVLCGQMHGSRGAVLAGARFPILLSTHGRGYRPPAWY